MELLGSFIVLLLLGILGLVLPALLAAWLFTLVLPVPFDQMVWVSLGMLVVMRYVILNLADTPGVKETDFAGAIIAPFISFILLAVSGLCSWLLLQAISLDLTLAQAIILFAISLTAGAYFSVRSGTGGLPHWMTALPEISDEFESDNMIIAPRPPGKRKNRTKGR
jgi:hypothetical protein